jgi:cell division protein FtsA
MSSSIVVGLDIGTSTIKVIVAKENLETGKLPKIIGFGQHESRGLRHGYITNHKEAVLSIRKAVTSAEKSVKQKINKIFLSVGGIGLSSYKARGSVMITRADSEVTDMDIEKVLEEARTSVPNQYIVNRRIIHSIPIEYYIDGNPVLGNPVGLKGVKLEADVLFVTSLEHHVAELIDVVNSANLDIIDVMAAPLAASIVTLTKAEKIAGCALVNIGSETLSIVVYEDDTPISMEVFQIGSNDITNDIALGLQVPLDEAENLKKENDQGNSHGHPQKKLDEIIQARLSDMFDLVDEHLDKIGKKGLLPAGIIITGGGSRVATIEDIAKAYLKLPSKLAAVGCNINDPECKGNVKIKDAAWAVSYGLCVFGILADEVGFVQGAGIKDLARRILRKIVSFIKQFLP